MCLWKDAEDYEAYVITVMLQLLLLNEIIYLINTLLCPIKVNGNTIEFTVHTSFELRLDLLHVNILPFR